MVKRNMICLEKGRVSVIRHFGDNIEFIKRDGEVDFPVTVDFWEWWKKALSYLPDDELDICFVYDKEYDLMNNDFYKDALKVNTEDSVWNIKYIKNYFWKLKPTYFNITLIGANSQEITWSCGNGKKCFYTNINIELNEANHANSQGKTDSDEIDEDNISPIAKYFIDLIRKERGC